MAPVTPVDPWASGPCECMSCRNKWVGSWRIGGPLKCPSCGATDIRRTMERFPIEQPSQTPFFDYE